uniref:Uncharacterized protein n=1 Tax=Oryza brachyantha TaxID=4533 RepID=J3L9P6_ORYBR
MESSSSSSSSNNAAAVRPEKGIVSQLLHAGWGSICMISLNLSSEQCMELNLATNVMKMALFVEHICAQLHIYIYLTELLYVWFFKKKLCVF